MPHWIFLPQKTKMVRLYQLIYWYTPFNFKTIKKILPSEFVPPNTLPTDLRSENEWYFKKVWNLFLWGLKKGWYLIKTWSEKMLKSSLENGWSHYWPPLPPLKIEQFCLSLLFSLYFCTAKYCNFEWKKLCFGHSFLGSRLPSLTILSKLLDFLKFGFWPDPCPPVLTCPKVCFF